MTIIGTSMERGLFSQEVSIKKPHNQDPANLMTRIHMSRIVDHNVLESGEGSKITLRRRKTPKECCTPTLTYLRHSSGIRRSTRHRSKREKENRKTSSCCCAMHCKTRSSTLPRRRRATPRRKRRANQRVPTTKMIHCIGRANTVRVAPRQHRRQRISFAVSLRLGTHSSATANSNQNSSGKSCSKQRMG